MSPKQQKTHVHMPSVHVRRADGSGLDIEEDLYFDNDVRPLLAGDPHEVANWALEALTQEYGLNDAEQAVLVGALEFCLLEQRAARLEAAANGERTCAGCGCSESQSCPGGCIWATETLCSRCV
jgi:hypothetical protein